MNPVVTSHEIEMLAAYMERVNQWRRSENDVGEPDPELLGTAIDCTVEFLYRHATMLESQGE